MAPRMPEKKIKAQNYPPAIEISSTSVRMIQLAKTQRGLQIAKAFYLPLSIIPHNNINSPQYNTQVRKALEKLVKENRIKGEVSCSLPLYKAAVLNYILPNMPESEIESAIVWKLKQGPPAGFTFENLSFDYTSCILGKDESGKHIQVLVFAAAKDYLTSYIKLFGEFSLQVGAVEPKPYSTFSALSFLGKIRQDEVALVLQIGATQSVVSVVYCGIPFLVRPLAVSGNSLTGAISNHEKMDWHKAEVLKKQAGLKGWAPQAGQATDVSAPSYLSSLSVQLENLIIDIEHTFKYFSHQIMKSQVSSFSRIILTGGASRLAQLDKFLEDRLGVAIDVFDPFASFTSGAAEPFSSLVKENAASFTGVLGLALRDTGLVKSRPINLLPKDTSGKFFARQIRKFYGKNYLLKIATFIIFVFAAMTVSQVAAISVYKYRLKAVKGDLQKAKVRLKQLQSEGLIYQKAKAGLLKEESIKKQRLDFLLSTTSEEKSYSGLLVQIARLLPKEVWVSHIIMSDTEVELAGSTLNNQTITQLMNKMDSTDFFTHTRFNSSEKQVIDSHTIYNFELTTEPVWAAKTVRHSEELGL